MIAHAANQDVHALKQKSSSICPLTPFKLKLALLECLWLGLQKLFVCWRVKTIGQGFATLQT